MTARLPVTLLSGLPNAGKTTLLQHLLTHSEGRHIAVIVNELRNPAVDGKAVMAVSENCRVCLSSDDVRAAAAHFAQAGHYDALVIESAGFSEPTGMAETFGTDLGGTACFDTTVTVIDAWSFYRDYFSRDTVAQRAPLAGTADGDLRAVIDVLADQVEFADTIVLNKCDQVNDQQRAILLGMLRALNPRADVIEATRGRVPASRLLATGRFDDGATGRAAGWMQVMRGEAVPETPALGIRSFAWQARRPFHPLRFAYLMHEKWHGVLRSKGFFWLASRNSHVGEWEQAGAISRMRSGGHWWCFTESQSWPTVEGHLAHIKSRWDPVYGDRRQELVFIGMGVDETGLKRCLEACLLTDEEMALGEDSWADLPDPLPSWHDDHDGHHGDHPGDDSGAGLH